MIERPNKVKFSYFKELLQIINSIIDKATPKELLDFIDGLDKTMLSNLIKNPKESNRENLLELILNDLGDYRKRRDLMKLDLLDQILKVVGNEYFDNLMSLILENEGYINLPILEALAYIDKKRIKHFLSNSDHRIKFDFGGYIKWDFHLILYILLLCFNPEELVNYLERHHRNDLFRIALPNMLWFRSLKMSKKLDLDMKHFLTAFFLEGNESELYFENLNKLGQFLADVMLSEISDIDDESNEEINLKIIKAIDWLGGEAQEKLDSLSQKYDIEKYRDLLY